MTASCRRRHRVADRHSGRDNENQVFRQSHANRWQLDGQDRLLQLIDHFARPFAKEVHAKNTEQDGTHQRNQ